MSCRQRLKSLLAEDQLRQAPPRPRWPSAGCRRSGPSRRRARPARAWPGSPRGRLRRYWHHLGRCRLSRTKSESVLSPRTTTTPARYTRLRPGDAGPLAIVRHRNRGHVAEHIETKTGVSPWHGQLLCMLGYRSLVRLILTRVVIALQPRDNRTASSRHTTVRQRRNRSPLDHGRPPRYNFRPLHHHPHRTP